MSKPSTRRPSFRNPDRPSARERSQLGRRSGGGSFANCWEIDGRLRGGPREANGRFRGDSGALCGSRLGVAREVGWRFWAISETVIGVAIVLSSRNYYAYCWVRLRMGGCLALSNRAGRSRSGRRSERRSFYNVKDRSTFSLCNMQAPKSTSTSDRIFFLPSVCLPTSFAHVGAADRWPFAAKPRTCYGASGTANNPRGDA